MTTKIYSRAWLNHLEIENHPGTGRVTLRISSNDSAVTLVPTAELADALGLVTREEHEAKLTASNRTVSALRAELDQANAREAAVREVLDTPQPCAPTPQHEAMHDAIRAVLDAQWEPVTAYQIREGDEVRGVVRPDDVRESREGIAATRRSDVWFTEDGWRITGRGTSERLYRRVKPKPPFVLPTEVPATIEAHPDWLPDRDKKPWTLHLWTSGKGLLWATEDGDEGYTPDQVMADFTNHRIVEAKRWQEPKDGPGRVIQP